jgi:hypothetical protein
MSAIEKGEHGTRAQQAEAAKQQKIVFSSHNLA